MRSVFFSAALGAMIITILIAPPAPYFHGLCASAFAEELWRQEFMDICAKTDEAMSFSRDELKRLLQRGEKLKPVIESLEETPRKVYLKRLQKCMNLYSFVLEAKGADKKQ
jgi:hypothetical protein